MKNILKYLIVSLGLYSCQAEEMPVLDLKTSGDEISRVELRADHKTLLPNGVAKMEFHTFVYGTKTVVSHYRDENNNYEYVTDTTEMEYLIPNDQLPEGIVKVYAPDGTELKDRIYSTTTEREGAVLEFYAKANSIESNRLKITIRELPDESYEELVIPVIFHMLIPPETTAPTYEISEEYLKSSVQRMNDIFNRRVTADPNGGNVKITFRLAEYDNAGIKLQEKGKRVVKLTATEMSTYISTGTDLSAGYKKLIMGSKKTYVWDPTRYLNIWLTKFSNASSEAGTYSYKYSLPTDMYSDYSTSSIPGLGTVTSVSKFGYEDVTDCLQVGVLVNYNAFLNPQTQGSNEFSLATVLGGYYGLLLTQCDKYKYLNEDGDNDYCPDTYNFDYGYYPSVYKANNLDGQPENDPNRPLEWFTSFGVMDRYSRKSSVSVDQALRMRKVLKQCPSRWAYKSTWAFTGK